ncbi:MAG: UDP-N-acetylglucosamine 2-epimerase (non-hydrolyzing) [Verrucomicrobia bacterium]|nr:UDP-N-acetylglucosamine 2-epimerase (non-hydrolyzing) [Verrucomicrobiota bacterium]
MPFRILTVVGARPQFIKAAPVSAALHQAGISEYLVHTGQHYDREMSEVFFEELDIRPPDLNLGIGSGTHGAQTGAMLSALEQAMLAQRPHAVLVYGDTNSTLAGTLAAAKLQIPVAHVEAGLRSFNRTMPEEINRIVADALSHWLFVPSDVARDNLLREGVPAERIHWTGDVMYDALLQFRQRASERSIILQRLNLIGQPYVLATIHRPANTDDHARLMTILAGLALVARELRVVLPLHPRTRARLDGMSAKPAGLVEIIEPVGFLDMIQLEASAEVITTDSGGVQKEAFFHGVPCVTLREETEWVETVALGWNRLCPPTGAETIAAAILAARGVLGKPAHPYGDGRAACRIAKVILSVGGL